MRGVIFFGIYIFLITIPIDTALLSNPQRVAQPMIVELAVGAGFVGLSLIALEFVLISRLKAAAQPFGQDALQMFCNIMGVVTLGLLLVQQRGAGHPTRRPDVVGRSARCAFLRP